ncbi:serine O-acetyltransferase, partial [Enterococcus faecalis]
AVAGVLSDVPEDVTVVGVPAKRVRVHGQKDNRQIQGLQKQREVSYQLSK